MIEASVLTKTKEWQLDHMPYEVMWMSEDGTIEYVNNAFCERFGYKKKVVLELKIYDINPRLTEEQWATHWNEVKQDKTVNFKTVHKKSDGFLYDVEVFAQFFSYNRKNLICAIISEITQSSFYKKVLDTSEHLVKMGGWKLNLQDQSLIATDEALKLFEIKDKEELRPINVIKYFDDPLTFQQLVTDAITKGEPYDKVLGITDNQGQHKWLRCVGTPVEFSEKVKKVIGVYQDITTQYENMLSLQLYKEIIDQSEDIVFIWKENGELLHYSNSAIKQLQFNETELDKVTIFDLDTDIDASWWANHFADIKNRKNFRMEWKATRKDGSQFPVDISVNYLSFEGEHLNCAILRDISDRKQYEDNLRQAFDEIKSLKNQLEKENEYLQEEIKRSGNFDNIICKSEAYAKVLKQVEQVAPTQTTVLITGESGTGKELLANALHQNSTRKDHVMVKINCATLPKELFESELFGHKKGAFTGAVADKDGKFSIANGGTIFLDEIGEMPLELQPKLLRVLQEGEFDVIGGQTVNVDVRIITATNRDLDKMVAEGKFREDLYYRLNVFPIYNIPLRERKEDIPALAEFFLQKYAAKAGKPFKRISKKAIDALLKYNFPGNIRELENLIERAVITESGSTLFPGSWIPSNRNQSNGSEDFLTFENMQKEYIIRVLKKTEGRVSGPGGAANILDMNDKTLFAKMKKLGIKKEVVISK